MVKVVEVAPAKRTTCRQCSCVLEYNYADITEEYVRDCGWCGDTYYRIVCPVCNVTNNVERWRK